MDTASHFVIGISIAGLAHISPAVANDPVLSHAIIISSIINSQAPDFDGLSRLWGGTYNYIKNHRGITHSIPAIFLLPTFISLLIFMFYPTISYTQLWFWSFLSVFIHVFLDIFNAYGTQVLRPFSESWVSFNSINIFDPFLFIAHMLAIILWIFSDYNQSFVFVLIFLITISYIIWRVYSRKKILYYLIQNYHLEGKITLLPTIKWSTWNIIQELPASYDLGLITNYKLEWLDTKIKYQEHASVEKARKDKKIKAFLYFTSFAYPEWKKTDFGYEVQFIDLRYRFKNQYPFLAIALLDENLEIIKSYTGWVYNQSYIDKKVYSVIK